MNTNFDPPIYKRRWFPAKYIGALLCRLTDHLAAGLQLEVGNIVYCERCLWFAWEDDPDNDWFVVEEREDDDA